MSGEPPEGHGLDIGWEFQLSQALDGRPSVVEQRLVVPACCVRFDLGPLDLPPCRAKRAGLNARSPTNFRAQIPQVKSDTTREGPVSPKRWVGHGSGSWWVTRPGACVGALVVTRNAAAYQCVHGYRRGQVPTQPAPDRATEHRCH